MSKIDVSKCEYFKKLGKFNFCNKYDCTCGDFNCDFKYEEQLRLIQQLKTENEELKEKLRIEHNNFNTLTNAYIETSSELLKFRKKMRNKNLKKENDRLKKVLHEIKARALNENAGELLEWIVDKEVKGE